MAGQPEERGSLAAPLAAALQGAAAEGGAEPMDLAGGPEQTPLAAAVQGGGIGRVPADADDEWYSKCVRGLRASFAPGGALHTDSDDVRDLRERTLAGFAEIMVQWGAHSQEQRDRLEHAGVEGTAYDRRIGGYQEVYFGLRNSDPELHRLVSLGAARIILAKRAAAARGDAAAEPGGGADEVMDEDRLAGVGGLAEELGELAAAVVTAGGDARAVSGWTLHPSKDGSTVRTFRSPEGWRADSVDEVVRQLRVRGIVPAQAQPTADLAADATATGGRGATAAPAPPHYRCF